MALATTYDFNLTQDQIVTEALRDIGVMQEVDTAPKAEALQIGRRRLGMILKNLQVRGIFLWAQETFTVPLVAGTSTYALDEKYIGVQRVYLRDSSNNDFDVKLITRDDYEAISDKTNDSRPTHAVVTVALDADTGLSGLSLTVWPVPNDATDSIRVVADRKLKDFDTGLNQPDAPAWFLRPLVKILAADLGRAYGLPMDIIVDLRREGYTLMEECMHRATDEFEDCPGIAGYF
jgi:hypothetical protein